VSLYHDQVFETTVQQQAAGNVPYRDSRKAQRILFPEQPCLILDSFPRPLFSRVYRRSGVQCVQQMKVKAPPVAITTDEAIDNQRGLYPHRHQQLELWDMTVERSSTTMEARKIRGLEIAANCEITREGNVWIVPSQSSSKKYTVNLFLQTCTCLDFDSHRLKCKHIHAAEAQLAKESGLQGPLPEKRVRRTYKQEWEAYNQAQINEKAKLLELLHELTKGIEDLPRKGIAGRNRLPFGEMIFCAVFKIYSMFSGRRFISDLQEAQRRGYISKTPHFNSIFNYLELPEMTACIKRLITESSLPLITVETNFASDSSGFSTGQFGRWFDAKYGKGESIKGEWVKLHLMCGCQTNIVTSVKVTEGTAGDSPHFKELVERTAENFVMNTVVADKAYSSAPNLKLVLLKGAQPYIPFRSNTNPDDKRSGSVWTRMYHFFMYNQDEFMRHYHQRSNVESTFSMIKAKFGERLRSKTETAQINEVLCKVLCHNLCCVIQSIYELGIEPDFYRES
jgi:transposase